VIGNADALVGGGVIGSVAMLTALLPRSTRTLERLSDEPPAPIAEHPPAVRASAAG
jgi:hypothetical protein